MSIIYFTVFRLYWTKNSNSKLERGNFKRLLDKNYFFHPPPPFIPDILNVVVFARSKFQFQYFCVGIGPKTPKEDLNIF